MPRKPAFTIDLNLKEEHEGYHTIATSPAPIGRKNLIQHEKHLAAGGASTSSDNDKPDSDSGDKAVTTATSASSTMTTPSTQQQKLLAAKLKAKAMSIATKPGQQIAMNAFMMWMSGKTLNIFSISITMQAILTPLQGIFNMERTFGPLAEQNADVTIAKLIFLAGNLVWLAMGLYKMSSMRLLPTTSADWTGTIVWKDMMETTSIPPAT